jgi:hypothetical protein
MIRPQKYTADIEINAFEQLILLHHDEKVECDSAKNVKYILYEPSTVKVKPILLQIIFFFNAIIYIFANKQNRKINRKFQHIF